MEKALIVSQYSDATSVHKFNSGTHVGTRANAAAHQAVNACVYKKAHPVSTRGAIGLISEHH